MNRQSSEIEKSNVSSLSGEVTPHSSSRGESQGAFPVSARIPFNKEFFAFAPEGGFYVKFMYSLTSDGMHKSD